MADLKFKVINTNPTVIELENGEKYFCCVQDLTIKNLKLIMTDALVIETTKGEKRYMYNLSSKSTAFFFETNFKKKTIDNKQVAFEFSDNKINHIKVHSEYEEIIGIIYQNTFIPTDTGKKFGFNDINDFEFLNGITRQKLCCSCERYDIEELLDDKDIVTICDIKVLRTSLEEYNKLLEELSKPSFKQILQKDNEDDTDTIASEACELMTKSLHLVEQLKEKNKDYKKQIKLLEKENHKLLEKQITMLKDQEMLLSKLVENEKEQVEKDILINELKAELDKYKSKSLTNGDIDFLTSILSKFN